MLDNIICHKKNPDALASTQYLEVARVAQHLMLMLVSGNDL